MFSGSWNGLFNFADREATKRQQDIAGGMSYDRRCMMVRVCSCNGHTNVRDAFIDARLAKVEYSECTKIAVLRLFIFLDRVVTFVRHDNVSHAALEKMTYLLCAA